MENKKIVIRVNGVKLDELHELQDYLDNIEDQKIQKIAFQVLNIEVNTQKPKAEKLRDIKRIIENITEDENQ